MIVRAHHALAATFALLAASSSACSYVPASHRVRHFVTPASPVLVYGASWCPVTAAAVAYLQQSRVPFVMLDVDRSDREREEMDAKVSEAGLVRTGIPVIDVHGRILIGFDRHQLDGALDAREAGR